MYKRIMASLAFLFCSLTASAQVLYSTGVYMENFNSLSNTGASNTWTNNTTLTGWSSSNVDGTAITTYRADNGSVSTVGIGSYGSTGSNDRGLGGFPHNAPGGGIYYGIQLTNNTATTTYKQLNISYTAEQWRKGAGSAKVTFVFDYSFSATGLTTGTFTNFAALNATAPNAAGGGSTAIDGNAVGNRVNLSSMITGINWAPGSTLWLRWQETDPTGAQDDILVLEDFMFEGAEAEVVPEPSSAILLSIPFLSFALIMRRKK